ncbi:MAG: C-GCAxxG-C-C family protein [Candidatus Odinarchaeota archaeon]
MNDIEKAVSCLNKGFNCSQAIFSTYGSKLGLDEEQGLKIAELFGAGMAYTGNICGAVTGAFMVLGLKNGRIKADDKETKEKALNLANVFINRFKAKNGTILCKELTGYDINTEEKLQIARKKKAFENCPGFVRDAAEILENLL